MAFGALKTKEIASEAPSPHPRRAKTDPRKNNVQTKP